ncbi:MAG: hypothetical protein J1F63_01420 [Oscillospiraceae bacterium]|nr:hypothetical protein [Oscillospiraceae bacterium]
MVFLADIFKNLALETVQYKLRLGENVCELTFKYEKLYNDAWDMRGYKYILNGREYTDIESFRGRTLKEIAEDILIREDVYGNKVLQCYESVPTFDSEDREWDGAVSEFLMFDGKDVNLVTSRYGYKIPSFKVYGALTAAPAILKPYFEELGFPEKGIKWNKGLEKVSKLRIFRNI